MHEFENKRLKLARLLELRAKAAQLVQTSHGSLREDITRIIREIDAEIAPPKPSN